MKFGRNLPRNQVPEWSSSYINYKGLKKLIKVAAEAAKTGKHADVAEFFYSLDRNVEDVDSFYNKKFAESSRRLKILEGRYGKTDARDMDRTETEELMAVLLELRGQLRKLQWFGEVNRRGFMKITKKLDKKVPNTALQQGYIATKVDPRPFATNATLSKAMKSINDWLSALGDVKFPDDTRSLHSVHSIKRVSSGSLLHISPEALLTIDRAVRDDDIRILKESLMTTGLESSDSAMRKLQVKLLQRAVSCGARACIDFLLKEIDDLNEEDDINQRNCLHRLVIYIGRWKSSRSGDEDPNMDAVAGPDAMQFIIPAAHPLPVPQRTNTIEEKLMSINDEPVKLLSFVLDRIRPCQQVAMMTKDSYGRLPLHYGAEYGIVVICEILMSCMQKWGQFNVDRGIDAPEWQDNEDLAPLHLSVIGGHALTTKALLHAENWHGQNEGKAAMRRDISKSSAVLALATKANFTVIVRLLVEAGVDVNWQDETGETALHVAARFGHEECTKILLDGTNEQKADIDLAEKSFSWTPLHVACVDGHLPIVELLIAAGAALKKPDASGWTAMEHAALRGHMDIAGRLAKELPLSSEASGWDSDEAASTTASPSPETNSLDSRRSHNADSNGSSRMTPAIKTFGHRYLTKDSMILVSLGSMDVRKDVRAVELDRIPMAEAHATELDTALSLVVSAIGANGDQTIIDLPVHDNISTEPISFTAPDASKVKILFDMVPTYSGNERHKVGRGVALLNSIKPTIGSERMNLQGDLSVPIIGTNLEVIGTVNFSFLVITPFSHPNMGITEKQTYWKSVTSTMVIGHRGLGKNLTSNKSLQLGENTIQSFIAAANLGANYVEFDVQLTKDHVPVIYHDFLVSETGIDAPVHTLTLEQFLHVNQNSANHSRAPSPDQAKANPALHRVRSSENQRQRSFSVGHLLPDSEMDERMKHTRDFKQKGYKANSRGKFIQAPFTTLEEMFNKLPEHVGFNIELKYPMLFESEEHEMDTYAVELNSYCDTILKQVYDMGKKRNIIFSSFNPDVCLLLSFKQPSIPILFLTDAGTYPVGDIRASSLQEAIRFASRWNLLGVVSAAAPLCNSPRLVRVVKESGLVCVSYGTLNNDPIMVQQQVKEGIDAVIVDNVLAIRKGLTERASKTLPPAPHTSEAIRGNAPTNGARAEGSAS
ncbi:MAG: Glycerophosphocholine phosphodiesterase [Claussenomyces sp. TS43310]|nr:MAG: Glycerophosphocholine phosphodiesterase [Claussenomyces sp. TS43310]